MDGTIRSVSAALAFVALLVLSACNGTPAPSQVDEDIVATLNVSLQGFIGGDNGDGGAAASAGRGTQKSNVATEDGIIPGANGRDLKDMT
ncbi:MAG: hypothetical protein L6Q71_11080, partial [Planctomycetes bacterium]|nr:hypothetical protein [Planctomycetota bacterium]